MRLTKSEADLLRYLLVKMETPRIRIGADIPGDREWVQKTWTKFIGGVDCHELEAAFVHEGEGSMQWVPLYHGVFGWPNFCQKHKLHYTHLPPYGDLGCPTCRQDNTHELAEKQCDRCYSQGRPCSLAPAEERYPCSDFETVAQGQAEAQAEWDREKGQSE